MTPAPALDRAEFDRYLAILRGLGHAPAVVPMNPNAPPGRKLPLVRWAAWPAGVVAGPDEYPGARAFGLLTGERSGGGEGGVVVVDIDAIGPTGTAAFEALEALEARLGPLPATLTVRSPSGGLHVYLASTPGVRYLTQAGQLAPGIDVRAEGGLVVTAGSWHDRRGGHYRIE